MSKASDSRNKNRRKAWLYTAALILTCATLTYSGVVRVVPAYSAQPPVVITGEETVEALRYRSGLFNMLLCVTDYNTLNTLTLISVSERGEIQLLAIPKDTRIRTPAGHITGEAFTRLGDVFEQGGGGLDSAHSMRAAVSTLLGGIPVDHCVTLSERGLARVVDALGGVMLDGVRYYDFLRQVSAEEQPEGERPADGEWICLSGEQATVFALHSLLSDAQGALLPYTTDLTLIWNMSHTVDRLIERMRERSANQTIPLIIGEATCSTLDEDAQLTLITRFNKPIARNASPALLNGEEYKQDFYSWLPDMPALKQWVLETCYEVR